MKSFPSSVAKANEAVEAAFLGGSIRSFLIDVGRKCWERGKRGSRCPSHTMDCLPDLVSGAIISNASGQKSHELWVQRSFLWTLAQAPQLS